MRDWAKKWEVEVNKWKIDLKKWVIETKQSTIEVNVGDLGKKWKIDIKEIEPQMSVFEAKQWEIEPKKREIEPKKNMFEAKRWEIEPKQCKIETKTCLKIFFVTDGLGIHEFITQTELWNRWIKLLCYYSRSSFMSIYNTMNSWHECEEFVYRLQT
mgnify:CR=1 FL=1